MWGWGNLSDVQVNIYVVSGPEPMYLYLLPLNAVTNCF